MDSPFDAAIAAAAETGDTIMGESFELRPVKRRADVNDRAVADGGRPIVTFDGIYGEPSARGQSGPVMRVGVKAEMPGHSTDRPFISVRLAQFTARPVVKDKIVRLKDGSAYTIAEILPDGEGLARLDLNRMGA